MEAIKRGYERAGFGAGRLGSASKNPRVYSLRPYNLAAWAGAALVTLVGLSSWFWAPFATECHGDRLSVYLLSGVDEFQTDFVYGWVGWICFALGNLWVLGVLFAALLEPARWAQTAPLYAAGVGTYVSVGFGEAVVAWCTANTCTVGPLMYVVLAVSAVQLLFSFGLALVMYL